MTDINAKRDAAKMLKWYRAHWTSQYKKYGKYGTWREPYETMYNFVEEQRTKAKKLRRRGAMSAADYICVKTACDKLQLELFLFLGDERNVFLCEIGA